MSRFMIIFKNEIFNVSTFLALAYNYWIYTIKPKNPAIYTGFLRKQTTKWKLRLRLSRER